MARRLLWAIRSNSGTLVRPHSEVLQRTDDRFDCATAPAGGFIAAGPGLQQSEAFGEYRQRRVVEHRLARLVQLGIRQSRYFGRAKTKFQLYLAATVANLTLVAAKAGRPANTGSALRAGTIRSALEIVPARLGQILTPALLASASLPEYTSPNKGFRPDF